MSITQEDFTKLFTRAVQLGTLFVILVLCKNALFKVVIFYGKLFIEFIPSVVFELLFIEKTDTS